MIRYFSNLLVNAAEELARLLNIKQLDKHCTNALYMRASAVKSLEEGSMKEREARSLFSSLKSIVTTTNAKKFASRHGYLFDGLITPPSSQAKTVLQYVIRDRVYCGKIGDPSTLIREFDVMSSIHKRFSYCPTVLKAVDQFRFDLEGNESVCLVLPFYPISLVEIIDFEVPDNFDIRVALCGLASIKAMNAVGICHGDIKPSNMMLDNNSDVIVLIDFGAATRYGSEQIESSPYFPMDVSDLSIEYDLTCLCSTILQLKGVDIFNFTSRDQLLAEFSNNQSFPYWIAMLCLRLSNVDDIIREILAIDDSYTAYVEKIMPQT
jgi:serine/threonine protein kinase